MKITNKPVFLSILFTSIILAAVFISKEICNVQGAIPILEQLANNTNATTLLSNNSTLLSNSTNR
ncbi:MAG: hypothetical protein ACTHME_04205 [Candidatus Nitrosocosmicus sp.]